MELEFFFDYACPYCQRGQEALLALLPDYPGVHLAWRPCEAHPRPERHGLHSDLCARGMYIARDCGADLLAYHQVMYRAALRDRRNIEDPDALAGLVEGLVDPAVFRGALLSGAWTDKLEENNRAAWDEHQFDAVPSLVLDGSALRGIPMIGLRGPAIRRFLDRACKS